jgi:hypothetical protein
LLPRTIVERSGLNGSIRAHALAGSQKWADTLFIRRRSARESSALKSFIACLETPARQLAKAG